MAELLPRSAAAATAPASRARIAGRRAPSRRRCRRRPAAGAARRADRFETSFAFSDRERLQRADFESMDAAAFELARKLPRRWPLPFAPVRRRRLAASARGRIDLRATMLAMAPSRRRWCALQPGEERTATIVVLLDVSGSMDRSPAHAALRARPDAALPQGPHSPSARRLTNITRALRHRDPDLALELASAQVQDGRAARGSPRASTTSTATGEAAARRQRRPAACQRRASTATSTGELTRAASSCACSRARSSGSTAAALRPLRATRRRRQALLPYGDRSCRSTPQSLADLATACRQGRRGAGRRSGDELNGERIIPASVDATWAASTTETLKACIAGCEARAGRRRRLRRGRRG